MMLRASYLHCSPLFKLVFYDGQLLLFPICVFFSNKIGRKMRMDTTTKAGNRRVSSYILTVCNEHPDHFGQYEKMKGKFRCIKHYWKADSQPEHFTRLLDEFERLAGTPCPFSTLRISDVTLHRLIDLLDLVDRHRVLVGFHRMIKAISERELARGYDFTALRPAPRPGKPKIPAKPRLYPIVRALYDCDAQDTDELSFRMGDGIELLQKHDSDWWQGKLGDKVALFPANYVKEWKHLRPPD